MPTASQLEMRVVGRLLPDAKEAVDVAVDAVAVDQAAGVAYVEVPHEGNTRSAPEEAAASASRPARKSSSQTKA